MHKWFRASDADDRLVSPAGQGYLQDEDEVHGTKDGVGPGALIADTSG